MNKRLYVLSYCPSNKYCILAINVVENEEKFILNASDIIRMENDVYSTNVENDGVNVMRYYSFNLSVLKETAFELAKQRVENALRSQKDIQEEFEEIASKYNSRKLTEKVVII